MRERARPESCNRSAVKNTKSKKKEQEPEDPSKYYTCFGEQEWIDDDGYSRVNSDAKNIYAQLKVNDNGITNYFVKANKYGKLFDPSGMYTEGQHSRFSKILGTQEFQFKKVSPRVFELYTSFLKTKNNAWLKNAEREMN